MHKREAAVCGHTKACIIHPQLLWTREESSRFPASVHRSGGASASLSRFEKRKAAAALGCEAAARGVKLWDFWWQSRWEEEPSLPGRYRPLTPHAPANGGGALALEMRERECVKLKHCRLRREVCICVSPTQNLTTGTFITICLGAGCGEWLARGSKQSPWVMLEGSSGTSLDVHALAHIFQRPGSTMTTRDRQNTVETRYTTERHFQTHMHAHTAWYRRGEG